MPIYLDRKQNTALDLVKKEKNDKMVLRKSCGAGQ
jgi:hypothetical protein